MSEIAKSSLLEYILENAKEHAKRDGRRTTAEYVLFECFEACVLYGDRTAEKPGIEKDEIRRVKERSDSAVARSAGSAKTSLLSVISSSVLSPFCCASSSIWFNRLRKNSKSL